MSTERLPSVKPLLRLEPRTGQLQERTYQVMVQSGPDAGKILPLRASLTVGTQPEVGLQLTDATVSRRHVELEPRGDGVLVRDLESTNGTFLGGGRIEVALLVEPEATIRVGKTALRVTMLEALASEEALPSFGEARSQDPAMRRLFSILARVALSDSTVLLTGETGTGKDVLARAIHAASPRRNESLVVIDCAAVAGSVIESELFGHAKGAFTGAVTDRAGAFLEAQNGTLFLDEIGELSLELQPKLLRALEAGTIKRVGEDRPRRIDVRVLAATHRDLEAEVAAGRFRQDLYYRLAVVPLRIPPLRERTEDLALFIRHFAAEKGRPDFEIPDQTLSELRGYAWPGNIRELRNFVSRALSGLGFELGRTASKNAPTAPSADEAPSAHGKFLPFKEAKERLVDAFTRSYLAELSHRHGGNLSRMAASAGIARHYLRDLLRRYGLRGDDG